MRIELCCEEVWRLVVGVIPLKNTEVRSQILAIHCIFYWIKVQQNIWCVAICIYICHSKHQ